MITEQNKKRLKPLFSYCKNQLGPDNNFDLAQLITLENPKLGPDNNFTAYIYIYIWLTHVCIYIFAVGSITWPP